MARRRQRRRARPPAPAAAPPARAVPAPWAAAFLAALPLLAVLALLRPYLWPLDRAPSAEFSDIHHQHLPYVLLLARGLAEEGAPPRWNPHDFAGLPAIGDPQAGTYNPIYWLIAAAAPSGHAFGLLIVAYTLAGALGFQLYARALGLGRAAAACGAVTFALGGALLLRLVLPGHVVFAPFFLAPLLLGQLERIAAAARPARVAAAGAVAGLIAVSLAPQMLLYATCLIGVLATATAARAARPAATLGAYAAVAALGGGLAAVHVLPILALAGEFTRGQAAFAGAARGLDFTPDRDWWTGLVSGALPADGMAWESHLYIGGVALFLALLGLAAWPAGDPRRRTAWLHGLLAAAIVAFALGPTAGLGPFRMPTRAFVVLALPLAVLVGLGVEALGAAPRERRRRVAGAAWGVALLVVLADPGAPPFLLLLLAAGAALLLDAHGAIRPGGAWGGSGIPIARLAAAAGLVLALALDAGRVVAPWIETVDEDALGRPPPGVSLPADLDAAVRVAELERAAVAPGLPEVLVRRRNLETLAGSNPLIPWRFALYASAATGLDPFAYHFDIAIPLLEVAEPVLWDVLGVTHVLHPDPGTSSARRWQRRATALPRAYLVPRAEVVPEAAGDDALALERAALGRLAALDPRRTALLHGAEAAAALAAVEGGEGRASFRPVALVARTPSRLRLDVTLARPGVLVLNEPFFPGWQAWSGETEIPVLRANVLFRALVLPAGRHHLRLEFRPASWRLGRTISLAALLLTLACMSHQLSATSADARHPPASLR